MSSPPPPASWQTYSDAAYGFSISYPDDFTFEPEGGVAGTALVMLYRTVDTCYLGGYPPGQVEFGVFARDAGTLTAWVQLHADVACGRANSTAFIFGVTNMTSTTVVGRDAVSFDDQGSGCDGPSYKGGATAFFLNAEYVFMLDWWSSAPDYSSTIRAIASQELASFKG